MIYVMSDIHGDYDKYLKALEKIKFNDQDTLYILGDLLDRGKHGLRILQDLMVRENVIPLLGNHEFVALNIFKVLMREITNETLETFNETFLENMNLWLGDGGQPTLEAFKHLAQDERLDILSFIEDFNVYEEIRVNDFDYFLVHAGLDHFHPDRPISDYFLHEFIFGRTDYTKVYFNDKILVTGHTPTRLISNNDKIYKENNHIAIDCGCGFGGKLGILRLDDGEEFYV